MRDLLSWRQAVFFTQEGGIYQEMGTTGKKIVILIFPYGGTQNPHHFGMFLWEKDSEPVFKERQDGWSNAEDCLRKYGFLNNQWESALPPKIEPYLEEMGKAMFPTQRRRVS